MPINFKQLLSQQTQQRSAHPRDIFNRLVKPDYIRDLLPGQLEVLEAWWTQRDERDTILKQNTGGGKTLVGLLISESTRAEKGGRVLYLCPNKHLVDQTIKKANDVGIPVEAFVPGKGVKLPSRFLSGEATLVAPYAALFNARSKFGAVGGTSYVDVSALILDDAHVELSALRDAFTISISAVESNTREVHERLVNLFQPVFNETGRGMTYEAIVEGKEWAVLEVPYWRWYDLIPQVADLVCNLDELTWPLIRDDLRNCHCLVGPRSVSIVPIFPPVDLLRTFNGAPRRIFMSATLTDDTVLAATFGLTNTALEKTISTRSLASIGERMILVPGFREGLEDEHAQERVAALIPEVAERGKGVCVLTPSFDAAEEWKDVGRVPDTSEKAAEAIAHMQDGKDRSPLVLAARYDGIDLADDACRLLVMDGKPQGRSNYETYRASNLIDSGEMAAAMAQRVEQGLGRGSRGGGDYCAVIVLGDDLVEWLSRHENWQYMTASTRAQIRIGEITSQSLEGLDDLVGAVWQCIDRDPGWVQGHQQALVDQIEAEAPERTSDSPMLIERRAYERARLGEFREAAQMLSAAADAEPPLGRDYKAWFLQTAARYLWLAEDQQNAIQLQRRAYGLNRAAFRPPIEEDLYVPTGAPEHDQASTVLRRIDQYRKPAAYVHHVYSLLRPLVVENAPYAHFERALKDLGEALGFYAERPDTGRQPRRGPDVLWLADDLEAFVIEAKNEKGEDGYLDRDEHGQLLQACEWFKTHYPDWSHSRVVALPQAKCTQSVDVGETRALDAHLLGQLVDDTIAALREIVNLQKNARRQQSARDVLDAHGLTPQKLRERFVEFERVPDRRGEPMKMNLQLKPQM